MKRDDPSLFAEPALAEMVAAKTAAVVRLLAEVSHDHAPAVFASSLGAEDMVLTDMIWRNGIDIDIFTIDTGRLPEETYQLIARMERHYGRRIEVVFPEPADVARYVSTYGIDGF
ncbi:MAG: phosphoadenosine phosphosulfate reductase family protein, partial [Rhodocyclaceae bacterium]